MAALAEYEPCERRPWTPGEDAGIREAHAAGTPWPEVARELARTYDSVKGRSKKLRAVDAREARRPWSAEDDDEVLVAYAAGQMADFLASSGRTSMAAMARLSRLGATPQRTRPPRPEPTLRRWSAEDDALLLAHYPDDDLRVLADRLGRTTQSVKKRAQVLGVRRSPPRPRLPDEVLLGPYQPQAAPSFEADQRWTAGELEALARLLDEGATVEQAAEELDRSCDAVKWRCRTLRLRSRGPGSVQGAPWGPVQLAFLTANYELMPVGEVAWRLGRTRHAVRMRAERLRAQAPELEMAG